MRMRVSEFAQVDPEGGEDARKRIRPSKGGADSVSESAKKKKAPGTPKANQVILSRFELLTSCLSSKRSKPTELKDLFRLPLYGKRCKGTFFYEIYNAWPVFVTYS